MTAGLGRVLQVDRNDPPTGARFGFRRLRAFESIPSTRLAMNRPGTSQPGCGLLSHKMAEDLVAVSGSNNT